MACYDFQNGNCRRGDSCRFSHDESGSRGGGGGGYRGQNNDGGYRGGGGDGGFRGGDGGYGGSSGYRGRGGGGESYRGGGGGGAVCYDWQNGKCRRGNSCKFSHEDSGGRPQSRGGGYRRGGEDRGGYGCKEKCNDFQNGRCHRGESCRFSHDGSSGGGGRRGGWERSRSRGRGGGGGGGAGPPRDGTVVRLNEKGFGFIEPVDGGNDIFFHSSGMHMTGAFEDLREGDKVSFEPSWDNKARKERAEHVQLLR